MHRITTKIPVITLGNAANYQNYLILGQSFLINPSSHLQSRLWNHLPIETRNLPTLAQFKQKLSQPREHPVKYPELLTVGRRYLSILHCRSRMGRSQLNENLFKIGVTDSPACLCGAASESVWHFFLTCPRYTVARDVLHTTINALAPFSLNTLQAMKF